MLVCVPAAAVAREPYLDRIPNAHVAGCVNCHTSAPNLKLFNPFGALVRDTLGDDDLPRWEAVCAADSDGDGYTNGEELGDPACVWTAGDPTPDARQVTLPGDPRSAPGPVMSAEPSSVDVVGEEPDVDVVEPVRLDARVVSHPAASTPDGEPAATMTPADAGSGGGCAPTGNPGRGWLPALLLALGLATGRRSRFAPWLLVLVCGCAGVDPAPRPDTTAGVGSDVARGGQDSSPNAGDVPPSDTAELATADGLVDDVEPPPIFNPGDKRPVEHPCVDTLLPPYLELVRPHLDPCQACHNSTIPADWMPHGGPQWFDPEDARATIQLLIETDLLDAEDPMSSLLLTKPLATSEGGVQHAGGDHVLAGSTEHSQLTSFVLDAAACLSAP